MIAVTRSNFTSPSFSQQFHLASCFPEQSNGCNTHLHDLLDSFCQSSPHCGSSQFIVSFCVVIGAWHFVLVTHIVCASLSTLNESEHQMCNFCLIGSPQMFNSHPTFNTEHDFLSDSRMISALLHDTPCGALACSTQNAASCCWHLSNWMRSHASLWMVGTCNWQIKQMWSTLNDVGNERGKQWSTTSLTNGDAVASNEKKNEWKGARHKNWSSLDPDKRLIMVPTTVRSFPLGKIPLPDYLPRNFSCILPEEIGCKTLLKFALSKDCEVETFPVTNFVKLSLKWAKWARTKGNPHHVTSFKHPFLKKISSKFLSCVLLDHQHQHQTLSIGPLDIWFAL